MVDNAQFHIAEKKLSFEEVILGHLKKILELSSHELRDTSIVTIHPDHTETKTNEDTRHSYIQAIENLCYLLKPRFNETTDKNLISETEQCLKIISLYNYEIKETFKYDIKKALTDSGRRKLPNKFYVGIKLKAAKRLFFLISKWFKDTDFFGKKEDKRTKKVKGRIIYSGDEEGEGESISSAIEVD